jgi:hypothetical protein
MANAQTVNVIGAISLDQAPPALRAPGLSVSLYVLQANAEARP